jgi:hypothetical protein
MYIFLDTCMFNEPNFQSILNTLYINIEKCVDYRRFNLYFVVYWYILLTFGIYKGHLVSISIYYK